jgi:hypothetical protein
MDVNDGGILDVPSFLLDVYGTRSRGETFRGTAESEYEKGLASF